VDQLDTHLEGSLGCAPGQRAPRSIWDRSSPPGTGPPPDLIETVVVFMLRLTSMPLSDPTAFLRRSCPPLLLIGALFAACTNTRERSNDDDGGNSGGAGGGPTVSPDGIAMSAAPVTQARQLEGVFADDGKRFLVVSFEIGNSSQESLSLDRGLFKVRTTATLEISPHAHSAYVPNACPQDTLVASGGSYACTLCLKSPTIKTRSA
jgi:hypothetical protein